MQTSMGRSNPEKDQDRAFDCYELFCKTGQVMFWQQRSIYQHLSGMVAGESVLEVGCGQGTGTAILGQKALRITGTDKLQRNVDFAKALYPWIDFHVWDIRHLARHYKAETVVAVEVIEHLRNPWSAIDNLLTVAERTIWISTPNGRGKKMPPENPEHVWEYAPEEMLHPAMLGRYTVIIRDWESFAVLQPNTTVDPLVYQVVK